MNTYDFFCDNGGEVSFTAAYFAKHCEYIDLETTAHLYSAEAQGEVCMCPRCVDIAANARAGLGREVQS